MEIWYILWPRGTELSKDANVVVCQPSDRISHLRQKVFAANPSQLEGLDASQLDVCETAESEIKCLGTKELSKCTSGTAEHPFFVLYSRCPGTQFIGVS